MLNRYHCSELKALHAPSASHCNRSMRLRRTKLLRDNLGPLNYPQEPSLSFLNALSSPTTPPLAPLLPHSETMYFSGVYFINSESVRTFMSLTLETRCLAF